MRSSHRAFSIPFLTVLALAGALVQFSSVSAQTQPSLPAAAITYSSAADCEFNFDATLTDRAAHGKDAEGQLNAANKSMAKLMKR